MLNYRNLNDVEFEYVCQDVMSAMLGVELHRFAAGRDGGIDLRDGQQTIMIQVKHYAKSSASQLISSLKKELPKVNEVKPKKYYVCCSQELTPQNVSDIYNIFKDYMVSTDNILTLNEIDDFLSKESNIEILKKHHKLWIAPCDIIQSINTYDIDIDSAAMVSSIETDLKLFVQTQAYQQALAYLINGKSICIIGDPGVGKSITSKMLAYYFMKQGFRLRYTTDGMNLSGLKKALAHNPDIEEIIVLDDCFGQIYFNMKDTQENELLSLIKYINLNPNKRLIINSRITIFNEASNRTPALITSINNGEYKLFRLNLGDMLDIDKALILYNHLYFSGLPSNYFAEIKKNRRYYGIIKHSNYNPRIIEYVCNSSISEKIPVAEYHSFIVNSLNRPNQVWRDEYERRLNLVDRVLLTTLYSLTNTSIPVEILQHCFNYRLERINGVDLSIDQFNKSLSILEKSMIKVVDNKNIRCIAFANPSVVDFLSDFLKKNTLEYRSMVNNSITIRQLKRLLSEDEFGRVLFRYFQSHEIEKIFFSTEREKRNYIVYYISKTGFLDEYYYYDIEDYLINLDDVDIFENYKCSKFIILQKLLEPNVAEFYKIDKFLYNKDDLNFILSQFEFEEFVQIVKCINVLFTEDCEHEVLSSTVEKLLNGIIEQYCSSVPIDTSYIDIDSIIKSCVVSCDNDDGPYFDETGACDSIDQEMRDLTMDRINTLIHTLPDYIQVDDDFIDNLDISIYGAEEYINDYMCESKYDPELMYDRDFGVDEIDLIFKD